MEIIKIYDDDFVIAINSTEMNQSTDENGYVKDKNIKKEFLKNVDTIWHKKEENPIFSSNQWMIHDRKY